MHLFCHWRVLILEGNNWEVGKKYFLCSQKRYHCSYFVTYEVGMKYKYILTVIKPKNHILWYYIFIDPIPVKNQVKVNMNFFNYQNGIISVTKEVWYQKDKYLYGNQVRERNISIFSLYLPNSNENSGVGQKKWTL